MEGAPGARETREKKVGKGEGKRGVTIKKTAQRRKTLLARTCCRRLAAKGSGAKSPDDAQNPPRKMPQNKLNEKWEMRRDRRQGDPEGAQGKGSPPAHPEEDRLSPSTSATDAPVTPAGGAPTRPEEVDEEMGRSPLYLHGSS